MRRFSALWCAAAMVLASAAAPVAAMTEAGSAPLWLWGLLFIATAGCLTTTWLWLGARNRTSDNPAITPPPYQLLHDEISGLPNRWLARQDFQQFISAQPQAQLALVLLKIERFDRVNQLLGYSHANLVLSQIARRLNQAAGQHQGIVSLSSNEAWVAHLGGVDFLLLVDQQGKQHQAGYLAHQLEREIAEPLLLRGCAVDYQIISGISCYPQHGTDFAELLEKAHLAMQQRSLTGSDSPMYQQEMSGYTPDKLAMMAQLQQAIAANQLQLDVQPQVLLPDRQVVAAEVLLRWAHPEQGLLAPKQFIPLAETMGLMFPLTCWVLRQTVQMLATLQQEGIVVQLAVNISSSDLLQIELVEHIQQLLAQYQVKPAQLILELKEDALMAEPLLVLPMLQRLRALGLMLVLDDFGTGYTSLGMLREFPLQQVKIDAQFISGMHKSDAQVAITGAIIDLAKNLQLDVVAEGVEEQACAEKLTRMGCLRAQGFLFSQPFALAGLPAWMRQHQFNAGTVQRPGLL